MDEIIKSRRTNVVFFVLVFVCALFLLFNFTSYLKITKYLILYLITPASKTVSDIALVGTGLSSNISDILNSHDKSLEYRQKLDVYLLMEKEFENIKAENNRLRAILRMSAYKDLKSITAGVILRDSSSWYQWFSIDKGSKDGIIPNSAVISIYNDKTVAVGRVYECYDNYSKVALITSHKSSIPVQIADFKLDCLLEGQNSEIMKLSFIPSEAKIQHNDLVITSALSDVFPYGIIVGRIREYTVNEDDIFSFAKVVPEVNLNSLYEVVVLVPDKAAFLAE